MRTPLRLTLLAGLLAWLLGANQSAHAIWAPEPLEMLVDQASVIIAGKVLRVEDAGFAINGRKQNAAVIEIWGVPKLLPGLKSPKEVRIAQPAPGGIAVSTDGALSYNEGQEGVWLLKPSDRPGFYKVRHPSQYQTLDKREAITKLIAARNELPYGKEQNGLVARAEVIQPENAGDGPAFYEVRFCLINVSKEPITLCNYVGSKPLRLEWRGPDGQPRASMHYDWLQRARLAGVTQQNFITLQPGEVQYISPDDSPSGIYFRAGEEPAPTANALPPGEHTLVLSFTNQQGPKFGFKKVWTGTITANPVTILAK